MSKKRKHASSVGTIEKWDYFDKKWMEVLDGFGWDVAMACSFAIGTKQTGRFIDRSHTRDGLMRTPLPLSRPVDGSEDAKLARAGPG
jgi:hypothetical protein